MLDDGIKKELEAAGLSPELLAKVNAGYMRDADYTQKTQDVSRLREQVAFAMGQGQGQPQAAPTSKRQVDIFLDQFEGEEAAATRNVLQGLAEAMQADLKASQEAQIAPMVKSLKTNNDLQELDRRLESELIPMFGEGIRGEWPALQAQMQSALTRNELVDPTAFVLRAMPDKAAEFIGARRAASEQQQAESTTEGFVQLTSPRPAMTSPGGASSTPNGATSPDSGTSGRLVPSSEALQQRFMAVASEVAAGSGS